MVVGSVGLGVVVVVVVVVLGVGIGLTPVLGGHRWTGFSPEFLPHCFSLAPIHNMITTI